MLQVSQNTALLLNSLSGPRELVICWSNQDCLTLSMCTSSTH